MTRLTELHIAGNKELLVPREVSRDDVAGPDDAAERASLNAFLAWLLVSRQGWRGRR